MRAPIPPTPEPVVRWAARAPWLRRLDALAAWAAGWGLLGMATDLGPMPQAVAAAALVAAVARITAIRLAWRPVSGLVALRLSHTLAPGRRAWYVRPETAELVIVTARRGLRLTIAAPGRTVAEGMEVRRTRVLLLDADEGVA
ncbi:MAG TPA: hypothetical protein VNC82_11210 [Candidatus Limnocylindria bacterium]|nr:hypothetical protein [Candidatus Limnocylindria bacterium]